MKKILRKVLPQSFINNLYHFPEAILANIIYGFPTRGIKVIGVTGTDGKTTTVNMVYQILKAAGKKVSMVSTINAKVAGKTYDTGFHITSPGRFALQNFAKKAKENGDEYLILEVTSHALDQYRFWGIKFDVGVITNITHEHLDYHKTFENYFKTKIKLIKNVKFAIINQSVKQTIERPYKIMLQGKVITFGLDKGDFNQRQIKLNLSIFGKYNIENALAALAVAFVLGIDKKIAQKVLENFSNLKGRMEEIENKKGIKIFIDFAHTPNALEQALKSLKEKTKGKLIAVFGSAGKRDVEKRALMGQIAARFADFSVVTAEDPRGELEAINKEIIDGAKKTGGVLGKNLFEVSDRKEAISLAINKLAKKGDTVGIFGKGHEESLNLDGKNEIPWSDQETAMKVLNE